MERLMEFISEQKENEDKESWVEARAYLREIAESNAKDVAKSFAFPLQTLFQLPISSFCSTLEEEDKRYGPLIPHLVEFAELKARLFRGTPWAMVRKGYYPNMDLVWDGWEAAYIVSKRSDNGQATSPDVHGASHVMRKRKLWEYIPDEEGKEKANDSNYTKEFIVAVIACAAMGNYNWEPLELVLEKSENEAIKNLTFEFYVKVILTAFDEDDLKRLFHRQQLFDEYLAFRGDLLQAGLMAAIDKRKLKSNAFFYLTECDMYGAVQNVIELTVPECGMERMRPTEIEHFKPKAYELIKQHKPLKRDLKAQLILELTRRKCYHVTDILILEAINASKLPKLFLKCISESVGNGEDLSKLLCSLGDRLLEDANCIYNMKGSMLAVAEKQILIPLSTMFGPCKAEVTQVIKIANYERAVHNEHFISPAHILVGLCLSRVSEFIQEEMIHSRIDSSNGFSSAFYTYRIYQLSCSLANDLGDGEMGLEHFVFAIVYDSSTGNLKELATQPPGSTIFKRLRKSHTECWVQGWRNADVFTTILEKRCRARDLVSAKSGRELIMKLPKDIESGRLKLPEDEVLRAHDGQCWNSAMVV